MDLVNFLWTYNIEDADIDQYDPWMGILAAAAFVIMSTPDRLKIYTPGQLIFVRDMILLIKHTEDW